MAKSIISEGKTTAEAIEKGLKLIGLPKELVDIKVIEENKKSKNSWKNRKDDNIRANASLWKKSYS